MKQPWHDIALQVGGSLYPEAGGNLLVRFGETVVEQCVALCDDPEIKHQLLNHFNINKNK
jgi:hypothetical protein